MSLEITQIKVGELPTNCYLVRDGKNVLVIDPGDEAAKIIEEIEKIKEVRVKYILLTHGHYDHVLAVDDLTIKYPMVSPIIHEDDIKLYQDLAEQGLYLGKLLHKQKSEVVAVSEGSSFPFGEETIKVIHTPGHTKGSVCYQLGDALFSGDTLFYHNYGRIDLPWSQPEKMKESIDKVLHLPESLRVLPGHGRETTIGEELNFSNLSGNI